jgi:hypothetical protein
MPAPSSLSLSFFIGAVFAAKCGRSIIPAPLKNEKKEKILGRS